MRRCSVVGKDCFQCILPLRGCHREAKLGGSEDTPGRGPPAWGLHKAGAKVLIFWSTVEQKEMVTAYILKKMEEASMSEECIPI